MDTFEEKQVSKIFSYADSKGYDMNLLFSDFELSKKIVDESFGDMFKFYANIEGYKPYNFEYCNKVFMDFLSQKFGGNQGIIKASFIEVITKSPYKFNQSTVTEISNLIGLLGTKSFVKHCEKFDASVKKERNFHEISLLITELAIVKARNFGDESVWFSMETIMSILFLFLIEGDSMITGHFKYTNVYFKANQILNSNKSSLNKDKVPNWLVRDLKKVNYDVQVNIPITQYFFMLQNLFYFYECMIYKHSLKLFDMFAEKQCRYLPLMTNFFRELEISDFEKDFVFLGIDTVSNVKDYVSHKKTIFFQTAFKTIHGNHYLGTELLTENGRKLVVFGSTKEFGRFMVEINLSDIEKSGNLKFYSMVFDWQLEDKLLESSMIIQEIATTYVYLAMEEAGALDRISHINIPVVPQVLSYSKNEGIYDIYSITQSEYREIAPIIRRLPAGQQISDEAKAFAKKMNYHIPDGYTFVKEHEKRVIFKSKNQLNEIEGGN